MAVNKVVYGTNTVMDITDTTAEASDVVKDKVFYGKNGAQTVGTAEYAPLSHTHIASDITSGELALARGGTGQSFADFAALSDAVGSGGNWVDVTTKFYNEMTINDSNFSKSAPDTFGAFIYEKEFIAVRFVIKNRISLTENQIVTGTVSIPDWAKPKQDVSSGTLYCCSQISRTGHWNFNPLKALAASFDGLGSCAFYALATPYTG